MAKFVAMVEQASDATWTASVIGEHTVLGTGETKEAAIDDLRDGIVSLQRYLKSKGQTLPEARVEVVEMEVAA
jgi:predicted RNase H-like HicB family nuclease